MQGTRKCFAKVILKRCGIEMFKMPSLTDYLWPLLRKANFAVQIPKVMIIGPQFTHSAFDDFSVFNFGYYEVD